MEIGIVGLGMIGGSIAKALKRHGAKYTVVASDIDADVLSRAKKDGAIDGIATEYGGFSRCEIVIVAVPCALTVSVIKELDCHCRGILTDVASVKGKIERECAGMRYVGGHPMAGVENGGYGASKAHMFENAYYVLTGKKGSADCCELEKLILDLGAKPYFLSAEEHDKTVAEISHLPHAVAFSLVNTALTGEDAKLLAAGGFKDITRIASSDDQLWTQICALNKDHLANAIDAFIEQLTVFKRMVTEDKTNQLSTYMRRAKEKREGLLCGAGGGISKAFELSVDIEDRVGMLGTITSILAKNKISIANIGVENSREGQPGVLKISFFDRDARLKAEKVLKSGGVECLGI